MTPINMDMPKVNMNYEPSFRLGSETIAFFKEEFLSFLVHPVLSFSFQPKDRLLLCLKTVNL